MKSSWSPGLGDVQMMSSLFVKVDCRWEEAAEDGASASPCSGPSRVHFHSPQASICHVPPTWAASPRVGCSWLRLLAAADPDTQTPRHRHRPRERPLPTYPSKPTRKLPPICVIPRSYRPGEFIAHFIRNTSSHYNFCDSVSSAPLTRHQVHSSVYNQLFPTFFTSAVTETILLYSTLPPPQLLLLTTSSIPPRNQPR